MSGAKQDYVPVGRLLVSAEHRPASVGRLLVSRGRSLIGVREGAGPPPTRRAREVARAARIAAGYARLRKRANAVTLPARGDVAIRVVAGYKVFDLAAGRVTTLLHRTTDEASTVAIVEQLRRASACVLAPAVLSVDVPRRTYAEEYVDGRRLRGLDASLRRLPAYLPLLVQVISALPPHTVPLGAYTTRRAEEVRARTARLAEAIPDRSGAESRARIEAFVDLVLGRLAHHRDLPVPLMLSHGDLHGGNVCMTSRGPRIIDWGLSDVRTPSYDLYHRLFRTAWLRRQPTLPLPRARAALHAFASHLTAHPSLDTDDWQRAEEAHRLLFYLECLAPKWQGEASGHAAARLRRHLRHIASFEEFERQCAGALVRQVA